MLDGVLGREDRDHLASDGLADLFNGIEVQRVAHREIQLVLDNADRDDRILLGDVLGNNLGKLGGNIDFCKIDELDAELHLQRFNQLLLGNDAVGNQHLAETALLFLLQCEALFQFFLSDGPCCDQQVTQTHICHLSASCTFRFAKSMYFRSYSIKYITPSSQKIQ